MCVCKAHILVHVLVWESNMLQNGSPEGVRTRNRDRERRKREFLRKIIQKEEESSWKRKMGDCCETGQRIAELSET